MENCEIILKIANLKAGTVHRVTYSKSVSPAKAYKGTSITKTTSLEFRSGVNYSNIKAVKERRAMEPPKETTPRAPWWGWVYGYEKRIKYKLSDPNCLYFNVCPMPGTKIHTQYYIDGKLATREEVMNITPPSMWSSGEHDTLDIAFENIVEIV